MNVMVGVFLAQLHVDLGARATNVLPRPLPALMIVGGILMWSYPTVDAHLVPWSRKMQWFMYMIGPSHPDVISRYWVSVGPSILMLGITFSRTAQRVLTLRLFNFLGRCSYGLYIIHHTMIRTVLVWLLFSYSYLNSPLTLNDQGDPIMLGAPSTKVFIIVVPIFVIILYTAAHLWTVYVDAFCIKIVDRLKELMFHEEGEPREKGTANLSLNAVTVSIRTQ